MKTFFVISAVILMWPLAAACGPRRPPAMPAVTAPVEVTLPTALNPDFQIVDATDPIQTITLALVRYQKGAFADAGGLFERVASAGSLDERTRRRLLVSAAVAYLLADLRSDFLRAAERLGPATDVDNPTEQELVIRALAARFSGREAPDETRRLNLHILR